MTTHTTATEAPQRILADTICGALVVDFDLRAVIVLTPCCGASGKGSTTGGVPATVCRSCYSVVSDIHGAALDPTSSDHEQVLADYLYPALERFAVRVVRDAMVRATRLLGC